MTGNEQKISQYVGEAHALEVSLRRVLEAQITMTPRGAYRRALEDHLHETQDHVSRLRGRQRELGAGGNPVRLAIDVAEAAAGQALALAKTPLDLLRGTNGDEKVLKNAKDACATEAYEIATYNALEDLARDLGDQKTADLAASIRSDEEAMLARVTELMPSLAGKVATAVDGSRASRPDETRASRAQASADGRGNLPIDNYDDLNAADVVSRLSDLSQDELREIDDYERRTRDRKTVTERISSLRSQEANA